MWQQILVQADSLADRLRTRPEARANLTELTGQLRDCPAAALDGYVDGARELRVRLEQARRLIDLDPDLRDPFWALRDALSDITRGMADILDQMSDPLFSSEDALMRYLSVLDADGASDLRDILQSHPDIARRRLVAAIAYRLARSRDVEGIAMWFRTARPQLGNRTPATVLEGDRAEAAVLLLPLAGGSGHEAAMSLGNQASQMR